MEKEQLKLFEIPINENACTVCGEVLKKQDTFKCFKCGAVICPSHSYAYVDGNNRAITKNSPEYCPACAGIVIEKHKFERHCLDTRWQKSVLSKMEAEGLTINSDWKEIEQCFKNVICPDKCLSVAKYLRKTHGII